MTKAAPIFIGLAALIIISGTVPAPAQDNNAAITAADQEAVMRQANTIVLRQKLTDAKATGQRGDIAGAAKLYQESCTLAETIGSGIPDETAQAVAGLTDARLALARDAQARGDYHEADTQVKQILNVERELRVTPRLNDVLAFKKHNDDLMALYKGRTPDAETQDQIPPLAADRVKASTLVQDGKVFYEMGKYQEAEQKLNEAVALDPDNTAATYYLNLIEQAKIARDAVLHNTDTQGRMEKVEKQWILPKPTANLPAIGNPYATNTLVFTGPGRQEIVAKLNKIHLESVSFDGLPLSEVLKQLSEQCKIHDPDRKGINFLINKNPDLSGQPIGIAITGGAGGLPGVGGALPGVPGEGGGVGGVGAGVTAAPQIDPATGLPIAPAATSTASEQQDVGSYIISIPSLTDVRLADVLDAIVLVADHPIKYSIQDFAVVFSAKGPETPQMFMRSFRVDPNTFYSGLENVSAQSFGAVQQTGGGTGGGGGGGGQQQNSGAVVGVVNAFSGAGGFRNTGNGGGGGGGGGGQGGSGSLLNPTGGAGGGGGGGGGGAQNEGGLAYITTQSSSATPSALARAFFTTLGVNLLSPPGKSVFFNDRLGVLFVKATEDDLDTIERALQVLNQVPPQVHIKARFIEVQQKDDNELGFDWYLGQFNLGNQVVGTGGTSPSLTVPTSSANPLGAFPGNTTANIIPGAATDQSLTQGLRNSAPTLATFTGILTDPNFRVALRALSQRTGVENLGEPEITVISGRQTQMRATSVVTVVVGLSFQQGQSATSTTGLGGTTP
jgi:tetratricopeptide (TPR) repeat protein